MDKGFLTQQQIQEEEAFVERMEAQNDPTVLKTSQEWYQMMPVHRIHDEDGWRDLSQPREYWNGTPISWKEFMERYNRCTLTTRARPCWPYQ